MLVFSTALYDEDSSALTAQRKIDIRLRLQKCIQGDVELFAAPGSELESEKNVWFAGTETFNCC